MGLKRMKNEILYVGIASLVTVVGIMANVFSNYVKNAMKKLDKIDQLDNIVSNVNRIVDKVEIIYTDFMVMKETTKIEVNLLKNRIEKIEEKLKEL